MIAYPNIDPIAFSVFGLSIRWYGIAYILAFYTLLALGNYRARTLQIAITKDELDKLSLYLIIGVVVGGRLGEVFFYYPNYYLPNPLEIFKVWKGGLSFHGGMLGVILAMVFFARNQKIPPFLVLDSIAPLVPLGLFYGRIANFINAELIGRATDVPWAMIFPGSDGQPRHPSQLYQALAEGLILFIVLWFYSRPKKEININPQNNITHPRLIIGAKPLGAVSGMFLVGYGVLRFVVEFTRTPDTFMGYYPLGLSMGQFLCLLMFIYGVYLILTANKRQIIWQNSLQVNTQPTSTKSANKRKGK